AVGRQRAPAWRHRGATSLAEWSHVRHPALLGQRQLTGDRRGASRGVPDIVELDLIEPELARLYRQIGHIPPDPCACRVRPWPGHLLFGMGPDPERILEGDNAGDGVQTRRLGPGDPLRRVVPDVDGTDVVGLLDPRVVQDLP